MKKKLLALLLCLLLAFSLLPVGAFAEEGNGSFAEMESVPDLSFAEEDVVFVCPVSFCGYDFFRMQGLRHG